MSTTSPAPLPPGSLGLPWLGETLAWATDPFGFLERRFERHGPVFKTRLFGDTVLCCGGPEAFTAFLDTAHFSREGGSPPHVERLVGNGTLPFVDGPEQQRNKRRLLTAFEPAALADYTLAVSPVIDRFLASWEKKGQFAWYPEIESMTLVLFDTLFAGADPSTENVQLRKDLDVFLRGILALPLPVGGYAKALKAKQSLLSYIGGVIQDRRNYPRKDALSRILAARDDRGQGFSDEQVAAEMIHIFFAGYGAMAANFAFSVMALGEHPEVRERARKEVLERTSSSPSYDELMRLDYVGQVWKEILRFYPGVPHTFLARVTAPTTVAGYQIPVGWKAMGIIYSALHDARVYREPQRFDPDRFGPERAEDRQATNAFIAQGGGAADHHRCLGESVSGLVMRLFLAKLLRGFAWDLEGKPGVRRAFPVAPASPMPVRFRRAG